MWLNRLSSDHLNCKIHLMMASSRETGHDVFCDYRTRRRDLKALSVEKQKSFLNINEIYEM